MKPWMLLILSTTLILMLSGCTAHQAPPSESTPTPAGEAGQSFPSPSPEANEFETFLETWELSGLIPADIGMTEESQNNFMHYFQQFEDIEREYIVLLLQNISANRIMPADGSCCDAENGVYLRYCHYGLHDMNLDGFPEFIMKTGHSEADSWYTVYTMVDGELMDCGGLSGSHATLYTNGSGAMVCYAGHMGTYHITVSALEGTSLITQEIADGALDLKADEDYPELKKYGYEDYDQPLEFHGIPTLYLAPAG